MFRRFSLILFTILSCLCYSQSIKLSDTYVFGEYYNPDNPITKLVVHQDSTFEYYDWVNGSCWATVNKSGFFKLRHDTLILISKGECFSCFSFVSGRYIDSSAIVIDFDSTIHNTFPGLKVSFDFEFEKFQYLDSVNSSDYDIRIEKEELIPIVINLRSEGLNSDIFLDYYAEDTLVENNSLKVGIVPGFEKNFKLQQELFAKYKITYSGDLKLCVDSNSISVKELKKKE